MLELRALLLGITLPLILTMVALWLVHRSWARRGSGEHVPDQAAQNRAAMLVPLVMGAAWVVACLAGWGFQEYPPRSSSGWLPLTAGAVGLWVIGEGGRIAHAMRWLRFPALAGGMYLLSRTKIANEVWTPAEAAGWILTSAAVGTIVWESLRDAGRERGWQPAAMIVVVGCAASATLLLTGHITAALMAGGVCAVVGPGLIVGVLRPGFSLGSAVGVPAAAFALLMYFGCAFGETPRVSCLLILAALGSVGIFAPREGVRSGRGWAIARWGVLLGLLGGAVGVALMSGSGEEAW